jgi:hypothetical protein
MPIVSVCVENLSKPELGKIVEQLNEFWAYTERVTKEELLDKIPITYQNITSHHEGLVEKIDQALFGIRINNNYSVRS